MKICGILLVIWMVVSNLIKCTCLEKKFPAPSSRIWATIFFVYVFMVTCPLTFMRYSKIKV